MYFVPESPWCKKLVGREAGPRDDVKFPVKRKSQAELNITVPVKRGTTFLPCSAVFRLLRGGLYDPWVLSEFVLGHRASLVQSIRLPVESYAGDSQSVRWKGCTWDETTKEKLLSNRKRAMVNLRGYSGLSERGMSRILGVSEVDGTNFHQQCNSGWLLIFLKCHLIKHIKIQESWISLKLFLRREGREAMEQGSEC